MQGRERSDHKRKGKSNKGANNIFVRTQGTALLYCFQVYEPILVGFLAYSCYLEMSLGAFCVNSDIKASPLIQLHFWMCLKYKKV